MNLVRLSVFFVGSSFWLLASGPAGHGQTSDPPAPGGALVSVTPMPPDLVHSQSEEGDEPEVGDVIAAGMGLGAVGVLAGGLAASLFASGCTGDYCRLEAVVLGAGAAGTVGMAVGVHLGNRRRGNLALDVMVATAIWVPGVAVAVSGAGEGGTLLLFVAMPVAQLAATVAVERAVGRSRLSAGEVSVSVLPSLDGSAALSVSLAL